MKNIIKQSILLVSILLQTAGIFGNDFSTFPPHKKPGEGYEKSRRSKTIKMSSDDFYDIKRTMHAGRNYYISVEGRNKLGNVQFRVRNVETNEIMYDNSAFGFSEEVILYNDVKQKVVIEI
ncbi:MAG: hypothetical protein U9N85_02685, partial [Bacteroidota bacterium]|nr:hypothetical protein [Bacteroidota bacterium]